MRTYHIYPWNEILKANFVGFMKDIYQYLGKAGLERAKKELIQFERTFGKKPTTKSKGMNTIYTTARLGKWNEFGIKSWNDLLRFVFGEIHIELNKYVGKKDLDRAIREMLKFREKNGKNPTSKTDGFKGIYDAARRGQWKEFGITSWNDLLEKVFN